MSQKLSFLTIALFLSNPIITERTEMIDGVPAKGYGDPHFGMFNGGKHDYMGISGDHLYQLITTRTDIPNEQRLPFEILYHVEDFGIKKNKNHQNVTLTSIDYLVLHQCNPIDNYCKDDWFGTGFHYCKFYDIKNQISLLLKDNINSMYAGDCRLRGHLYTTFEFTNAIMDLVVDDEANCSISIKFIGGLTNEVQAQPPTCDAWKRSICGMLGTFDALEVNDTNLRQTIVRCDGTKKVILPHWWQVGTQVYDEDAWSFLANNTSNRRRLKTANMNKKLNECQFLEEAENLCAEAIQNVSCDGIEGICKKTEIDCGTDLCFIIKNKTQTASHEMKQIAADYFVGLKEQIKDENIFKMLKKQENDPKQKKYLKAVTKQQQEVMHEIVIKQQLQKQEQQQNDDEINPFITLGIIGVVVVFLAILGCIIAIITLS